MCLGLGWEAGGLCSPTGAGKALHQRAGAVSQHQQFRGKLLNGISLWAVSGNRLLVWLVVFFLPSLEYCTAVLYNHSLQALGTLQNWPPWISELGLCKKCWSCRERVLCVPFLSGSRHSLCAEVCCYLSCKSLFLTSWVLPKSKWPVTPGFLFV